MKQKSICMKQIIYIVTTCVFISVSPVKAQRIYSLKDCLEEGLQNNYSLRIVHNEEQISKNNATLGNAGYLPTLDFSAGYTGNLDNIETKARATGEVTQNNGVYDQTVNVGLNLNWTIFDGFNAPSGRGKMGSKSNEIGVSYPYGYSHDWQSLAGNRRRADVQGTDAGFWRRYCHEKTHR